MHITLISGLSTDITSIQHLQQHQRSPAQWSSPSHHTTTRSLYSAPTSARPIHHNWYGSSYHWNTTTTHQCRHRPSPLGLQQYPLSASCSRSYSYKPSPTGTTAMGYSWRYQQWRRVLLDESRFCISSADGRVRVWRRRCERYTHVIPMDFINRHIHSM